MGKFKSLWMILLLLAGFLFFTGAAARSPELPKAYPFPLMELEEVISRWLQNNGFETARTPLREGQVQISAVKKNEHWRIILKPRSPLICEVQAECVRHGQPDWTANKELWDHLRRYAQNPSAEKDDYGVPSPVLARSVSVVCIKAEREAKPIQFSGFFIDREGLILATAHDLEGIHEFSVILDDGRELKGSLRKVDHDRDLALITVGAKFDSFISLTKGRNLLGTGERVYSIGCPVNLRGTVHAGFIDGPPRRVNSLPLWQVDMEILPGSSGSPVFDGKGNVVAVVKGRYRGTDSVGFLIPLETVMDFLKEVPTLSPRRGNYPSG
jgi:serine protease Do